MSRVCTVCTHPDRNAIDRALVESAPMRRIAAENRLAETSVRRHAAKHLPAALVLATEAAEVTRADGLMAEARRLHGEALGALEAAKASGHFGATLQALDRAQRSVALLATLLDRMPATAQPSRIEIVWTGYSCEVCGFSPRGASSSPACEAPD